MEITGRITRDAEVKTFENGSKVVNFSIAVNYSYKSKTKAEIIKETTYFDCSYSRNEKVAAFLTKGTVVELSGRISARAWLDKEGKPRASLHFRAREIVFHGGGKVIAIKEQPATENTDDLPF